MRAVKKHHLPEKPCVHCARPMRWRRRWARVWEQVRYCSERCRRSAAGARRRAADR
ncbi:MAG: DUF2256 domain-containing protein [Pseudomonadales bacterium]